MKPLKIFLSPFAYYVRLDADNFEENSKKGSLEKWIDNRKGMLLYEFIEFEVLDRNFSLDFPKNFTKLGLRGSRIFCYNPFSYRTSVSSEIFKPKKIISESDRELDFTFNEFESCKLNPYNKYYTKDGQPWINKIKFYIDESTCNLAERINYSNGLEESNYYHLISKTGPLEKPEFYALFNFD